jgi:hypothetical protein
MYDEQQMEVKPTGCDFARPSVVGAWKLQGSIFVAPGSTIKTSYPNFRFPSGNNRIDARP